MNGWGWAGPKNERASRGVYPYLLQLVTNAARTILGEILLKFNKFQYTKIHIIIAVKWVFSLSEYTKINVGWAFAPDPYLVSRGSLHGRKRMKGRERLEEGEGEWGREGGKLGNSAPAGQLSSWGPCTGLKLTSRQLLSCFTLHCFTICLWSVSDQ